MRQRAERLEDLAIDFLEKECARFADLVFCSTLSSLDWMKKEGWELPSKVHVFPFDPSKRKDSQTDTLSFYRIIRPEMDFRLHLKNLPSQDIQENLPFVSVCMTHFNRPHCLSLALESIRAQDYPHFEVVLVDDASDMQEAGLFLDSLSAEFSSKGWQIIRNPKNLFPGAARNLAAARSRGVYLLFMDDDNIAAPHEISSFVKAALKTGADILTCAMDVFEGPVVPKDAGDAGWVHRFIPLGAAASVGLYLNLFGDINALIKKRVYEELGGLSEDHGVGGEDWEFFGRAILRGYHLETIPSALFWYRQTPGSITKATSLYANSMRAMRPYLEAVPKALRANLLLGQGQLEKLERLLLDHQSPPKLLKRSLQLVWARAVLAFRQPGKTVKKIASYLN